MARPTAVVAPIEGVMLVRIFNAETALRWAQEISFPRLVGTSAEVEARGRLRAALEQAGLTVAETPFRFFPMLSFGILKNMLALGVVMLLAQRWLLGASPRLGALLGLLIPLVASRLWRTYRTAAAQKLEDRQADYRWHLPFIANPLVQLRSANLIADLPVRGPVRKRLTLSAHTDSKSQNYSIFIRGACSIFFALGVFVLPLLALPGVLWVGWLSGAFGAVWRLFWWVALLSGVVLAVMKVRNDSPGALDDAGACGALIGVAHALAAAPPEGVAVRIVLTGAEELGLAGGIHYVQETLRERPEWRDALHLNFEGVGEGRRLWLATGSGPLKTTSGAPDRAVELADRACREVGSAPKRLSRLIGGEADHIPMIEAGLSAVTIMFSGPNSKRVHTSGDRPDLLRLDGMDLAGRITLAAVRLLEVEP
jgi:hypothetical protein